jgi:tRNA (guanine-N7-)-methyltransferase
MENLDKSEHWTIRSYVLRAGRMSDAQRRSYETLGSRYCIPFQKETIKPTSVFENENPVVVEIGFGMGVATAALAEANPHINYLGLEVHRPGVGRLLWEIERRKLQNIRIVEHDAVEVLQSMIGDGSVRGFHIFFPDPWPKKRHHKRRLIQRPFTDTLAEKLENSGYLYLATDWEEYGTWALEVLSQTPNLKNPYGGFAPRQSWRPYTKFEQKGLQQERQVWELYFVKEEGNGK